MFPIIWPIDKIADGGSPKSPYWLIILPSNLQSTDPDFLPPQFLHPKDDDKTQSILIHRYLDEKVCQIWRVPLIGSLPPTILIFNQPLPNYRHHRRHIANWPIFDKRRFEVLFTLVTICHLIDCDGDCDSDGDGDHVVVI